ncbi:hypothetical protein ACE6H2_000035 [Prunus campanulata]
MADSTSKTLEHQAPTQASNPESDSKPVDEEKPQEAEGNPQNASKEEDEAEDDEEEPGECGFCVFMKGGGCKESFTAWEQCIEESEKNKEDIVEKCFEVTSALKKCMEAHPDYYQPILQAEKAAEAEAVKELEKEKAAESSKDQNAAASEQHSDSIDKKDA